MPTETANAPYHPGSATPPDAAQQDVTHAPGDFEPIIDRNRCEGKGPCVQACPFGVLSLGLIGAAERGRLTFAGRIKAWVHGGRQALAIQPEACSACGACVRACPEHAITLGRRARRRSTPPTGSK